MGVKGYKIYDTDSDKLIHNHDVTFDEKFILQTIDKLALEESPKL
jgi:hypothetical protein